MLKLEEKRIIIKKHYSYSMNPQIKIIFFFLYNYSISILMNLFSIYFVPLSDVRELSLSAQSFTLKHGSSTVTALIDHKLRVKIDDIEPRQILTFRGECMMIPSFNQKKVLSISIELNFNILTITGPENSVCKLYQNLTRLLSHKGFTQYYKPIKRIGRGTFATVYLVEHRNTGERRAAKVFSKQGQKIQYKGKEALENEIKTIREINHPNLIKYYGVYETQSLIYLVTEYLSGGTLDDTLKSKAILSGVLIQNVIRDILSGLAYLDENHIMHRDIKPQNVILRDEDKRWVIGDFGLAAKSNEQYIYDKCGTMGYIAPEIMDLQENQRYAQACDTYSLGIIAYQLIVGELPFKVESIDFFDKKLIWLMFDREECKEINPSVLEFLKRLLDNNPKTRITPKEALQSPFFKDQNIVNDLIAYHEHRKQARYDRILKLAFSN